MTVNASLDSNLEAAFPVTLHVPRIGDLTLSFLAARKLASELFAATTKIEGHFMCKAPFAPGLEKWVICGRHGTVKMRDGTYRCKRHAKAVKP